MNQQPPKELRKNVLLPRYPVVLIHGLKNFLHFKNYWHGIPEYLQDHGITVFELKTFWRGPQKKRIEDLKIQLLELQKTHPKLHLVSHSLGTLDSLVLVDLLSKENIFASLTLVSPLVGGTPWADIGVNIMPWLKDFATTQGAQQIVKNFKNLNKIPITAFISDPQYTRTSKVKIQSMLLSKILKFQGKNEKNDGLIPFEAQMMVEKTADHVIIFPGDHVQIVGAGPWPGNIKTAHEVFLEHCIFLAENDIRNAK